MALISYLQVEDLTKSYGDRMLFDSITFGVNQGDKIGVIAKNGTGKSTLLRLIAGKESADSGSITFRSGIRVAILDQSPIFAPSDTPMSVCGGTAPTHDDSSWSSADRARQLLTQLGIKDLDASVSTMSGGQQKRIALANTILQEPDLIILDEPTNHLDIEVIEWLENWLRRSRVTLLMVTHDRYFLDRVCNKIIELDQKQIFTYDGNYNYYLRRRQERIEALTGELAKVRNTLRKEQEWMSRQPQARAGKAKFRIDAFHDLKRRSQADYTERQIRLNVKSEYIGSKIFEASGVSKRFGDKVILDNFSYTFARYEKLGIVGHNGAGKSTFIKLLQGLIPVDSGEWNVG
ncbi:MAG: ATP-binding cassette domain-containing protein, partial [Muribaculaceae bacterium]|nr:ATP-binding cassette domain-containing protein [Muribaculaceae bacterium]